MTKIMKRNSPKFNTLSLLILVALLFPFFGVKAKTAGIKPQRMSCDYLINPMVLDNLHPRLGWINGLTDSLARSQKQSAWQIKVASSLKSLQSNKPDMWNSGKVSSDLSVGIEYKGAPLASETTYYWQVKVWDSKGRASVWSEPAHFTMGVLAASDWKAQWIGAPWQGEEATDRTPDKQFPPAPLLRKEFNVTKKVASAHAFVTGLGYFELYVNGKKVSEDKLVPNQTNYGKRPDLDKAGIPIDDSFRAYRVMYLGYDLTKLIQNGENAVGAILGNGFYNPMIHWDKSYGAPRFICQIVINYTDGTSERVVSDGSWKAHRSAIVLDGVFAGEIYDARKEVKEWSTVACDEQDWEPVALRKAPEGTLVAQNAASDKVMEQLKPVAIQKLEDGSYEVDFGEEISGWVHMKGIRGEAGRTIDVSYICDQKSGDNRYTLSGNAPESYAARFTWFVFRKVKISNWPGELTPDNLTAEAVYTNVETTGYFSCSNELFNKINRIWWRSQTDNMHGGVASDCPHRERSAYTGDGQVSCVTVMHNLDAASFYTKWIQDMLDGQNVKTGYLTNSAPWQPGCGGGVAWGAAMNIMPWEFYLHYGDREMLSRNYFGMKEQVRYMLTWRTADGIMNAKAPLGKEPMYWMNLGDWCPPAGLPADSLVHTFYLWRCADFTARTAKVLGDEEAVKLYNTLAQQTKDAFHKKFYDAEKASYGGFGSNIFALKMGVPEDVKAKVVQTLREEIVANGGHLNTGIFGTQFFFEVLAENGLNELAYEAMNKRDFPSFGHWIEQGATTTWEQWDGQNSRNHPMFGGALGWFYRKVAGFNVDEAQPGYKHIIIRPVLPRELTHAAYSQRTPYGVASVAWKKTQETLTMEVVVPVGSTATVYLPESTGKTVTESGKAIAKAKGVQAAPAVGGCAVCTVESGRYVFEVK